MVSIQQMVIHTFLTNFDISDLLTYIIIQFIRLVYSGILVHKGLVKLHTEFLDIHTVSIGRLFPIILDPYNLR